jgi:YD repeat-containing protein
MFPSSPTPQDIFMARLFVEPLVPVGPDPTPADNAAFATALTGYSQRSDPEDFSHLTNFLAAHPNSSWNAALLTNLGLEYYRSGRYSQTFDVWHKAWELAKATPNIKGRAIADRAFGELIYMHARLGHMAELQEMLASAGDRVFIGPATERLTGAREGLWSMQTRPEISFRCGPHALQRIMSFVEPKSSGIELFFASVSTQKGCSLSQVAELSRNLGLNLQMAFRERDAAFLYPSVIHFKLDHFAALIQQDNERYQLQDPTFGNDVWLSRSALESEASGYFLVPCGELGRGWRAVEAEEGNTVWGKGNTGDNDPGPLGPCDGASPGGGNPCPDGSDCKGLAVPRVHLMLVSLNINDEPVGYSPPLGPAVKFTVRYNQRDVQPSATFDYSNFGPKWTFDWLSYITEDSSQPNERAYYIMGGGTRRFVGFSTSQTSTFQQFDQTLLTRTAPNNYEMLSPDGSKKVFSQSDGSNGNVRKIFLTQLIDPQGNAVSLEYDAQGRIVTITDAIGQITRLSYDHPTDIFKITTVTDPFGRFATFGYDASDRLITITDVKGLASEFAYDGGDFITSLTTPYGVTGFVKGQEPTKTTTTRSLEIHYPDGNRERVEYNQSTDLGIPAGGSLPVGSDPVETIPIDMATRNEFLFFRNTYYWSKIAYAEGYPDYTKAKVYHWLHGRAHTADFTTTSGILESVKEPLEGRIWYDYADQFNGPIAVGSTNKPSHVGRVLDDVSTQLYTYNYNGFGHIENQVDPIGRTFSYKYAENGIDLLEIRQTRVGQNELLSRTTYNAQHLPLAATNAAGQTTTYTYDARGQTLRKTNAKNEVTNYLYGVNGHLLSVNGPLPGSSIAFTYDAVGRVRTKTDDGYTLTFDYDELDRLTKITFQDGTFEEFTYTLLDQTLIRDRAGRHTTFEYNNMRQMIKRTDPLNRTTLFQWCRCGALRSLTDPLGRTTSWAHDIQGRVIAKKNADGSKVTYLYEDTINRLRQRIDEQLQVTQYNYNRDDTVSQISYANTAVVTQPVSFFYDASYNRLRSMKDGTGTTNYDYIPINVSFLLGAGQLASENGPVPGDTITYSYDELGRRVSTAINGVPSSVIYDAAGRIVTSTNALGVFNTTYDGNYSRKASQSYPNGQTAEFSYTGNVQDRHLQKITNKLGITPISEFIYGRDIPTGQITSWSQQTGAQTPSIFNLAYDLVDQLTAASVSAGGTVVNDFSYSYDPASNRLAVEADATTRRFSYNALNELTRSRAMPAWLLLTNGMPSIG